MQSDMGLTLVYLGYLSFHITSECSIFKLWVISGKAHRSTRASFFLKLQGNMSISQRMTRWYRGNLPLKAVELKEYYSCQYMDKGNWIIAFLYYLNNYP